MSLATKTQYTRLLKLLSARIGMWMPACELVDIVGPNCSVKIGGHGFFRLAPGANVPSPSPIAAACQDSLFGDLTPEGYPD